jgi:hypothetical protein
MITTGLEHLAPMHLLGNQVAALTTITSPRFDMAGYDGVLFLVQMGTITATGTATITAHQAATDIDGAALTGASVAVADTDDDSLFAIDLRNPNERYVQVQIARATANSEIEYAVAIGYRGSNLATDLSALVSGSASVERPTEV